ETRSGSPVTERAAGAEEEVGGERQKQTVAGSSRGPSGRPRRSISYLTWTKSLASKKRVGADKCGIANRLGSGVEGVVTAKGGNLVGWGVGRCQGRPFVQHARQGE